jgi:tripartite-type tricarboxylate transporter receptor subunit TctC
MTIRSLIALCALLITALASASPTVQAYPSKPIRVIFPFQAGGAGEIVFRMLMPTLEQRLGQKIVFENRTGAGGNVGAQVVASAAPDGYTLLLPATNVLVVNQFVFANIPFDPLKAFTPITVVAEIPSVFYVNSQVPAATLREFIAFSKANAGKVNYASPGNGTTPHLNVELLAQLSGVRLTHVPYRGLPDAMNALLSGDVQLYLAGLAPGRGNLQAGKLRAIAVGSRERLAALPEVPTAIESGFKDFEAANWFALVAPAGTDSAVVERWVMEIQYALQQPDVKRRFAEGGLLPGGIPSADFRARLAREAKLWEGLVRTAGIKAE